MKQFTNTDFGVPYDFAGAAEDVAAQRRVEAGTSALPPEERALAALKSKPRFFMDTEANGTEYMIPSERRMDWDAFTMAQEDTCEVLPVPSWARPLKDGSRWVEFEMPVEALAEPMSDYDAWFDRPAPRLPGDDDE